MFGHPEESLRNSRVWFPFLETPVRMSFGSFLGIRAQGNWQQPENLRGSRFLEIPVLCTESLVNPIVVLTDLIPVRPTILKAS